MLKKKNQLSWLRPSRNYCNRCFSKRKKKLYPFRKILTSSSSRWWIKKRKTMSWRGQLILVRTRVNSKWITTMRTCSWNSRFNSTECRRCSFWNLNKLFGKPKKVTKKLKKSCKNMFNLLQLQWLPLILLPPKKLFRKTEESNSRLENCRGQSIASRQKLLLLVSFQSLSWLISRTHFFRPKPKLMLPCLTKTGLDQFSAKIHK